MVLLKKQVEREGREFTDLYLCWKKNNKVKYVRVRPVFGGRDFHCLNDLATEIDEEDNFEKYL